MYNDRHNAWRSTIMFNSKYRNTMNERVKCLLWIINLCLMESMPVNLLYFSQVVKKTLQFSLHGPNLLFLLEACPFRPVTFEISTGQYQR